MRGFLSREERVRLEETGGVDSGRVLSGRSLGANRRARRGFSGDWNLS